MSDLKNKYREGTIYSIRESFLPERNWGEDEFFYAWLDDTYRDDQQKSMKELGSFSKEEFKRLDALDKVVKKQYKNWMETKKLTDEMLAEINKKREEFLDLV